MSHYCKHGVHCYMCMHSWEWRKLSAYLYAMNRFLQFIKGFVLFLFHRKQRHVTEKNLRHNLRFVSITLMALLAMKPRFTQKQRRNKLFCCVIPFVSCTCTTACRVVTKRAARGNFVHVHNVTTNSLIVTNMGLKGWFLHLFLLNWLLYF